MGASSVEIVLANDSAEVVFGFSLRRGGKSLESGKRFRIVDAFFEEVKFRLTYSHLPFHLEHAFAGIIKRIETDWLKLQIL